MQVEITKNVKLILSLIFTFTYIHLFFQGLFYIWHEIVLHT